MLTNTWLPRARKFILMHVDHRSLTSTLPTICHPMTSCLKAWEWTHIISATRLSETFLFTHQLPRQHLKCNLPPTKSLFIIYQLRARLTKGVQVLRTSSLILHRFKTRQLKRLLPSAARSTKHVHMSATRLLHRRHRSATQHSRAHFAFTQIPTWNTIPHLLAQIRLLLPARILTWATTPQLQAQSRLLPYLQISA